MKSHSILGLVVILWSFCARGDAPLRTVPTLDLDRYVGKWYELGSFPGPFQEGCVASTATYRKKENGDIAVLNECRDKSFEGKIRSAEGKAWIDDPKQSPSKLKVQFFWPFSGNYWVLAVGPNYEYAVVGEPKRRYGWILSRTPHVSDELYAKLAAVFKEQGYEMDKLNRTPQPTSETTNPPPATK